MFLWSWWQACGFVQRGHGRAGVTHGCVASQRAVTKLTCLIGVFRFYATHKIIKRTGTTAPGQRACVRAPMSCFDFSAKKVFRGAVLTIMLTINLISKI